MPPRAARRIYTSPDHQAHTQRRLSMAARIADRLCTDPRVAGVLLTGSATQAGCDAVSDLDFTVYTEAPLPPEDFEAICARAKASGGGVFGGQPETGFGVFEMIDGIKCDFGYGTREQTETILRMVRDEHKLDEPNLLVVASGVYWGRPLHGADWLAPLQAYLADYPDALAEAVVKHHLRFYPHWVIRRMAAERGDLPFLHELLVQSCQNLIGLLCGANRLYPPGKVKGAAFIAAQLTDAPDGFGDRMVRMFSAPPLEAAAVCTALIDETLDVVAAAVPGVPLAGLRARLSQG